MVKLVDMPDLGSGAARRVGSSPIIRTKQNATHLFLESCIFFIYLEAQKYISTPILSCFHLYLPCPKGTSGGYRFNQG